MTGFVPVAEVSVDVEGGRVFEHGWQSWSPTTVYPVGATSHRPKLPHMQTMCWRPGRPGPALGFQGEGLLAVSPAQGEPVTVFAARDPLDVPSIRASLIRAPLIRAPLSGSRLVVSATGAVDALSFDAPIERALGAWADGFARVADGSPLRAAPTVWCSWYQYFGDVGEADVLENLAAIERFELPVDVIQIDDGWQAGIGDWLEPSGRFRALVDLVRRVRDAGRRAGLWIAPFLVGAASRLAREHPDWLVAGADAGFNWGQPLFALDVTHPGAAAHLRSVFAHWREVGFSYFKIDFCYAGALRGLAAYRSGLELIRSAVGPDAYLLGCGAPILPSVGLLDAMRVSPDVGLAMEPEARDLSRPSQRAATLSAVGRAWQHGRFWVNDPDCLLARPAMTCRAEWAAVVERYGGLRASSDRILDLDEWGLTTTRRLLSTVPAPVPFDLP